MATSDLFDEVAFRTVLVPLDGSDVSAAAVPTAGELARRFQADLHFLSVVHVGESRDNAREAVAQSLSRRGIADAHRLSVIEAADIVGAIKRTAAELDSCLLCLSTHGRGRVATALIGSVAGQLLHGAIQPLVLVGPALIDELQFVRPRTSGQLDVPRIVACVDGSPESEAMLPIAAAWARTLEISMTILTVIEPVLDDSDGAFRRHHGPDGDAEAYVAALVDRMGAVVADVGGQVHSDPLNAARGVRDHLIQHPAGLVAVSTRASVGRERLVKGSDAARIVQLALAPVLVVPHPQPDSSTAESERRPV